MASSNQEPNQSPPDLKPRTADDAASVTGGRKAGEQQKDILIVTPPSGPTK